jgi:flavin reductase (DIM6/NTAB) family NADH-FMN oxidoreductase RutF
MTNQAIQDAPGAEIDGARFRDAMRELAGGVTVVTVGVHPDIDGFTCTAVSSLAAKPPRALVCINQSSHSWAALQRHPDHFGINLLRDDERKLAERFAGRDGLEGVARYAGTDWTTLATGAPILSNALAALDCEVEEILPRYDHAIVIGRVRVCQLRSGPLPLVYWSGDYHRIWSPDYHNSEHLPREW